MTIMDVRRIEKEMAALKSFRDFLPVAAHGVAAREKLQAVNRSQALGKAVKLGLVFPTVY